MRVMPLTSLNGGELWPTLSPDGEQVAFSWYGERQDSRRGRDTFDIYLKLVGSSDVRRLTTDPGRNWAGGWSPDGRQIAYFARLPARRDLPLVASHRNPAQTHRLSSDVWTRLVS